LVTEEITPLVHISTNNKAGAMGNTNSAASSADASRKKNSAERGKKKEKKGGKHHIDTVVLMGSHDHFCKSFFMFLNSPFPFAE
jgi:hypothetical protein